MRILIVGVDRPIGLQLTRNLLSLGHTVVGVTSSAHHVHSYTRDIYAKRKKENLLLVNKYSKHYTYHEIEINLEDEELWELFDEHHTIHRVVYAATLEREVYPGEYLPDKIWDYNVYCLQKLLELCSYHQVRHLVYLSSNEVYSASSPYGILTDTYRYRESDCTSYPISTYGASCRAGELLAYRSSQDNNLTCRIARMFNLFGPGSSDCAWYNKVLSRMIFYPRDVHVRYPKQTIISVLSTVTAVDILTQMTLSRRRARYEIFNVGSNRYVSLEQFVKHAGQKLSISMEPIFSNNLSPEPYCRIADMNRTSKIFPYQEREFGRVLQYYHTHLSHA